MNEDEPSEPQVPAEMAEQLKALYGGPPFVPPVVDNLVLARAREHLKRPARARRTVSFPHWLAAAAVFTLCAWLGSLWWASKHPAPAAREDLNHDGRIDILDAFALARRLQQGAAPSPLFDINGDGVVDQKDIDAIAGRAVALTKGPG